MTDRTGLRSRQPHTPQRTCVGCRGTDSWSVLLRVVAVSGELGEVVLLPDPARCRPGRGAWVHPTTGCYDLAVRRRAFTRALRLASGPDAGPVREHLDEVEAVPPSTTSSPSTTPSTTRPTESGSDADEHPMSTQR